jgi:hypothetical protein
VVTAGRTAPACSSPGSMHGKRGKLHSVLEEGLGVGYHRERAEEGARGGG